MVTKNESITLEFFNLCAGGRPHFQGLHRSFGSESMTSAAFALAVPASLGAAGIFAVANVTQMRAV
jgi:hypothetical protein